MCINYCTLKKSLREGILLSVCVGGGRGRQGILTLVM